nr:hypothetical protein [Actinoplanes globisporus]
MDLLLYDQIDSPAVLAQTNQLLHPVEEIHLAIEVKSRLSLDGIKDSGKKRASINALSPIKGFQRPMFALFAYDAVSSPATVAQHLSSLSPDVRPDLTCVLDPGLIAGSHGTLNPATRSSEFTYGVTLLHDLSENRERERGRYVAGDPSGNLQRQHHEGALYPAVDFRGGISLSDPSRALLLFCEALIRMTAERAGRKPPSLTHYLAPSYRDIEQI